MEKKMPKRLIIVAGFLVITNIVSIGSIVLTGGSGAESFDMPSYLHWYNQTFQVIFGLASAFICLGLSILLLMGRNVRKLFNIYYGVTTFIAVFLTFAMTYKAPNDTPEVEDFINIMNTVAAKGMMVSLTLIFVSIILWAINSEKTRIFLGERPGGNANLAPSQEEVEQAKKAREEDLAEINTDELDLK